MNLDDLRSVQSKERQKDSLQHLRDSFYEDVGAYIANLKNERERAAERADDPFSSPDVSQLTDEIETAEEVVEAVYERRMGKIVKRASLAAAGMPTDEEGLTAEEGVLFTDLVDRIESNKHHVLDVLAGNVPTAETSGTEADGSTEPVGPADRGDDTPPTPPDRPPEEASGDVTPVTDASVDAAEVMGGDQSPSNTDRAATEPSTNHEATPGGDGTTDRIPETEGTAHQETPESTADQASERVSADPSGDDASPSSSAETDRTTVRITQDIGDIFGVDDREYELNEEDVVTLPTANAEPLVERDAAERLE